MHEYKRILKLGLGCLFMLLSLYTSSALSAVECKKPVARVVSIQGLVHVGSATSDIGGLICPGVVISEVTLREQRS